MDKHEEADELLWQLQKNPPFEIFRELYGTNHGSRFLMVYLSKSQGEVYAMQLSKVMGVSRARVATILKKLIDKGYIVRQPCKDDARKDIIRFTEKGRAFMEQEKQQVHDKMVAVIEKVGVEKMRTFVSIGTQIFECMNSKD